MKKPKSKDARLADSLKGLGARFALLFFIIVTIAMLVMGKTDPRVIERSRIIVIDFFSPVMNILAEPVAAFHDAMQWGENIAFVFRDNKRLRDELQRFRKEQAEAQRLAEENARLRALLDVQPDQAIAVKTVRIIADTGGTFVRSMVVNAGTSSGVKRGQPVLDDAGVIGRIIAAGNNSARVLLITDLNSRIPVKIADSGYNAILAGNNKAQPLIIFEPASARIEVGDRIITSGHGGIFPPDLPVGKVVAISKDDKIRVDLAAHMDRLNFVRIFAYEPSKVPEKTSHTPDSGSIGVSP